MYCRLATVASGAASGKLLQYEVGGPKVSVQTAYGVEVEVGRRIPLFILLSFPPTYRRLIQSLKKVHKSLLEYRMERNSEIVCYSETPYQFKLLSLLVI